MKNKDESVELGLAVLAHEMREPLAAILLAVQAQGDDASEDLTCRTTCQVVERQARHLSKLITDTLESYGELRLHESWFDLGPVLADAIESTRPLFSSRRHRLIFAPPDDQVLLLADAGRVRQVVTNLLANAAKYTEPGGVIRLAASKDDEEVSIEVSDNGVGITKDQLSRVFELFHRVEQPRRAGSPGLGIGLALVKKLVELHGGSVRACSEGKGTGATFRVRLPKRGSSFHPAHLRDRGHCLENSSALGLEAGFMCDA